MGWIELGLGLGSGLGLGVGLVLVLETSILSPLTVRMALAVSNSLFLLSSEAIVAFLTSVTLVIGEQVSWE